MATKKCKNGHQYDSSIYGDECPFCPSNKTNSTVVNPEPDGWQPIDNPTGRTIPINDNNGIAGGGATVIRHVNPTGETSVGTQSNRKLVGVLISYDENPMGEVYKIYEGTNIIGRATTSDIPFVKDSNMSSTHLLILYREAEGIYWAEDQKSSNGTYINGKFVGRDYELQSNDVIVIGSTKLIFLAIPQF